MKPKGRIHFAFGNPVNFKLIELIKDKPANEAIQTITEYIDKRIYYNYKLWPNNYIAYDLLNNTSIHFDKYSNIEKETFLTLMNKEIASLPFNREEATELYLQLYANPLINFKKHFE
jgi:hypothetical protein